MLTWLPLWVRAIESLALQARAVCANRNIGCGRSNGVCGPSAAAVVHDLQSIPKTFAIALTAKLTFCLVCVRNAGDQSVRLRSGKQTLAAPLIGRLKERLELRLANALCDRRCPLSTPLDLGNGDGGNVRSNEICQ
jgi:hypothetical protein